MGKVQDREDALSTLIAAQRAQKAALAREWWLMQTCQCLDRTGIVHKPSGMVICGDCGGLLPLQPPPRPERP